MTKDESTEMNIENWSAFDLKIVILMVAIIFVVLYDFFFNTGWVLAERNVIIIPAILDLILQPNSYLKRTALNTVTATYLVVKRMALNNVTTANSVIKRTAMSIIYLTVKRTYSSIVAVKNFVFKKPLIIIPLATVLKSVLNLSDRSRTEEAAYLIVVVLKASFNHINFAKESIHHAILVYGISNIVIVTIFAQLTYINGVPFIALIISIFFFGFLQNLHSHKVVNTSVALSIIIFAHNLVLSFVEIPDFFTQLLSWLVTNLFSFIIILYDAVGV